MTSNGPGAFLEVSDLRVWFKVAGGLWEEDRFLRAVDGVDFSISDGEVLGLVGESGSGKSTTGRAVLRLVDPTGGSVSFKGEEITGHSRKQMKPLRKDMQLIFQDPFASLNPRMRIGKAILEPLRAAGHDVPDERVAELLERVGLDPDMSSRFPHELSGGQRQRVGIARALSTNPSFIVCDEPTSALDVSTQAQIINLLADLRLEYDLALLFISHDLAVIRQVSDRVAVMYAGEIVELAPVDDLFGQPLHPYTGALLSAVPVTDPDEERRRERIILPGEVADPVNPPSGCRFHPRCPFATDICATEHPELTTAGDRRAVACHHWVEIAANDGLGSAT